MKKDEKDVTFAGVGWVVAGFLAGLVYLHNDQMNLLAVGVLAATAGLWIIFSRKRILKIRQRIERENSRKGKSK